MWPIAHTDTSVCMPGTAEPKQTWAYNDRISQKSPRLSSVSLGRDPKDMENVIAISAQETAELKKGSETKWIKVCLTHGLHSLDPWVMRFMESMDGWMNWTIDIGSVVMRASPRSDSCMACPFASSRSNVKKERPAMMNYSVTLRRAQICRSEGMLCVIYHCRGEELWVKRCMQRLSIIPRPLRQRATSFGLDWASVWVQRCRH